MGRLVIVVAILSLLWATASVESAKKNDPSVVMNADIEFAKATAEKRLEGFLSFIADDVATIRPDSPIIRGKKAFGERWAALLNNPAMVITWRPGLAAISDSGDVGYTVGSYETTRTDEKGKRVVGSGKYVTIWKKQRDGWKVVFDSGVQDTPPQAGQNQ